jgi:Zn-dependent protease
MDFAKTIQDIAIFALPIVIAVSFHEAAHGFVANRLGDPTARVLGRLTLNPLRHIDLLGTVLLPLLLILSQAGILFGYAKPVPVNSLNFKDPKKDMMWVASSGPLTNFSLALLSGILLRIILLLKPGLLDLTQAGGGLLSHGGLSASVLLPLLLMLKVSVQINVILGVFNLIPVPPLDGGRILMGILPDDKAQMLGRIEPFGLFVLIVLLVFDPLGLMSHLVFGLMEFLFKVFMFL